MFFKFINSTNFIGFQDPASPIMEGIIDLHNYIFLYLLLIFFLVLAMMINVSYDFFYRYVYPSNKEDLFFRKDLLEGNAVTHGTVLELVWTILPSIVLVFIAVPSFVLLYAMDEVIQPTITLKVIGHQWYWSYEYANVVDSNLKSVAFDSNMLFEDELNIGELRLLQVRSEEHTSELQSRPHLVCRLLLETKKRTTSFASSSCTLLRSSAPPTSTLFPYTTLFRSYNYFKSNWPPVVLVV